MSAVVATEGVVVRMQDRTAFLLHLESGRYFGLNRSGLVIWDALVAGTDPVAALAGRWPSVPPERRTADVEAVLAALIEAGLARRTEPDS